MGKTRATYEAIKTLLVTEHADDFGVIKLTLRTPFEAVEAGDLERTGMGLIIALTGDTPLVFSGSAARVLSSVQVSLYLVAMLDGRDGAQSEEQILGDLLDAADAVMTTLETANRTPATTFAGLQFSDSRILYDEDGNYASLEIQFSCSVIRI